ncbi:MAG: serine/threonine protein kinase [Acidobacteriota bacterium]|nr:serine/threonine protein kinase [Acidobacteriota bacterium]MDQ5837685.1 serine/threonine protein kinase [Acidobacteriota bacterium]
MTLSKATLKDGRTLDFNIVSDPPAGGMKKTYFSPDRSYVVQFYHDQAVGNDPQRLSRLEAILTRYNPTVPESQGGARGTNEVSAEYFKKLFCWPTGIVMKPEVGIVAPTYPPNYFFGSGPWKGKEKNGKWFSSPKLRKHLPAEERGPWINYFRLCILMARAVRRLHQAGLAHSDLSSNNILVDPKDGLSVVIDIDSLVVPGLYPPDVAGTPGYIAPEVLGTLHLPLLDPNRNHPSARTDQYALAVLIYEYLLYRHPLRGPKVNSLDPTEDEHLSMGSKAIFIENPTDTSNRPSDLQIPCSALGPHLNDLFQRTFVAGLHAPNNRPGAIEWERALVKTWDMLYPCPNAGCSHGWFVLYDSKNVRCPFCGTRPQGTIPLLTLRTERRSGQWMPDGQFVIYNGARIFEWHAFSGKFPGEEADRTPQAYCVFHQGQWLMINQKLASLTSPGGNRVPPEQAVALTDGAQFRLSQEPNGKIAEVQLIQL